MGAEDMPQMREKLGRVMSLLQATPFPPDLIDDPARTGQWLITLGNLHQAIALLGQDRVVQIHPAPIHPLATPTAYETRGERVMRAFNRMIDGLPMACLSGLSPIIKLGLIRPLLLDLEALERRLRSLPLAEVTAFTAKLTQYRSIAAAMAARHVAPDPPLRAPEAVPAR